MPLLNCRRIRQGVIECPLDIFSAFSFPRASVLVEQSGKVVFAEIGESTITIPEHEGRVQKCKNDIDREVRRNGEGKRDLDICR